MSAQDTPWEDLRLVLALVRGGGLSGAARRLGVNHTTVLRRLNAAERRLGARLFERTPTGYLPTPAGEEIAEVAGRVEEEVLAVERRVSGRDVGLTGAVRCATVDSLAQFLLAPHLAAFAGAYPGIVVELMVSERVVNLTRRDADVALRPTNEPPENLVGRKLGTIAHAVYASVEYAEANAHAGDLRQHCWLAFEEGLAHTTISRWMARHYPGAPVAFRANTLNTLFAAAKAGMGVTVLPCFMAEPDPALRRLTPVIPDLRTDLWLLSHADTRRSARVRAFLDFIGGGVRRQSGLLDCSDAG
jgi:DNA-binding transcriptional LysR family regulator